MLAVSVATLWISVRAALVAATATIRVVTAMRTGMLAATVIGMRSPAVRSFCPRWAGA